MKYSFVGLPNPRNRMSGRASRIAATIAGSSAAWKYPLRYPAITRSGYSCLMRATHSSTTSCCAPNRKTEYCLLYTSDAADERSSVDLGGRRIIKKKKYQQYTYK